jgi:hypothetical protein
MHPPYKGEWRILAQCFWPNHRITGTMRPVRESNPARVFHLKCQNDAEDQTE